MRRSTGAHGSADSCRDHPLSYADAATPYAITRTSSCTATMPMSVSVDSNLDSVLQITLPEERSLRFGPRATTPPFCTPKLAALTAACLTLMVGVPLVCLAVTHACALVARSLALTRAEAPAWHGWPSTDGASALVLAEPLVARLRLCHTRCASAFGPPRSPKRVLHGPRATGLTSLCSSSTIWATATSGSRVTQARARQSSTASRAPARSSIRCTARAPSVRALGRRC